MVRDLKILFACCMAGVCIPFSSHGQVPEIADPTLPDIAMVFLLPSGQHIIRYNPILCTNAGPLLCGFYRVHEYCHIALGHALAGKWPMVKELEADCCAAKYASQGEALAAYSWFSEGGGSSPTHGWGPQRAQRIKFCRQ